MTGFYTKTFDDDDNDGGSHANSNRPLNLLQIPSKPICRLVPNEQGGGGGATTTPTNIPITIVRFTADGKYCFTVGRDRNIILWNPLRNDPACKTSSSLLKKNDGNFDIACIPRGLPIQTYNDGIRYVPTAIAINENSTHMLVGTDRTAVLIDCITTKVIRQFYNGHTAVINSVAIYSSSLGAATAATNSIDQIYATASYDATVCLWDARTSNNSYRPIQILKEAKDSVTVVDIPSSADSSDNIIRTASVDGVVRTYDIRKGIVQSDNYGSPIISMASSQCNGKKYFAISCLDGAIRIVTSDKCTTDEDYNDSPSTWNVGGRIVEGNHKQPKYICRDGHVAGRYALECCFVKTTTTKVMNATNKSTNSTYLLTGSEDGNATLYDLTSATSTKRNGNSSDQRLLHQQPTTTSSAQLSYNHSADAPIRQKYMGHVGPTCSIASYSYNSTGSSNNIHPLNVIITASYDGQCIVWSN